MAPLFRALECQKEIDLVVLYCHQATPQDQARAGFGVEFDWNVSLLDGYDYEFLPNVSSKPGLANFQGLDTPELSRRITKGKFDAVVVNGWHYKSAWQAIMTCWKTGTPVLARGDSHLHTPRHPLKLIAKWPLYRSFIPRLDSCLPVGTWSRDYFLHYGADPLRVLVVPHIVDSDWISAEACRLEKKRGDLRRKWGLSPEDTVFAFAGKFVEKKRPLDFVGALGRARRMGASVCGLMV
jgi:glycosyltransferase involved in cell wall biosynthesis